jgi:hypothetical protein
MPKERRNQPVNLAKPPKTNRTYILVYFVHLVSPVQPARGSTPYNHPDSAPVCATYVSRHMQQLSCGTDECEYLVILDLPEINEEVCLGKSSPRAFLCPVTWDGKKARETIPRVGCDDVAPAMCALQELGGRRV